MSRRQKTRSPQKNTGCATAIFSLIGVLIAIIAKAISLLIGTGAKIIKGLYELKFTLPLGKNGLKSNVLVAFLLLIGLCCGTSMIFSAVDTGLRSAGVLPTYTPTPSPTATNAPTFTPSPTATNTPTNTPPPTSTLTPSLTPTATITPTATTIPTPRPTNTPAPPTATPLSPTATPEPAPRDYIAPGTWRCPDSLAGAAYVGSSTGKFHHPSCRHVSSIAPHNRVCFESREAAINAGYQPCGHCKP